MPISRVRSVTGTSMMFMLLGCALGPTAAHADDAVNAPAAVTAFISFASSARYEWRMRYRSRSLRMRDSTPAAANRFRPIRP